MAPDPSTPFSPCVVVPVYNHSRKIRAIAQQLRVLSLPCIFVDDGSDRACASALDELARSMPETVLLRQPVNRGKGVAVARGLRQAWEWGFSHALQVDADGQHDLGDAAAFLQHAQAAPQALVSGCRDYGAMPATRRRGRRFTDLWVHIHTLSFAIRDSMCGYRVYPLQETVALLDSTRIGERMDFDTDIIVRLYWRGVPVINVPTAVVYHEDMASHFDVWGDNIRISWMHTRLFFGMLMRIFRLLALRRR